MPRSADLTAPLRSPEQLWANAAGTNAAVTAAVLVGAALLAAFRPYPRARTCLVVGTAAAAAGVYACVRDQPLLVLADAHGHATAYALAAHGTLAVLGAVALVRIWRAAGPAPDFAAFWPACHLGLLVGCIALRAVSHEVFGAAWWTALVLQALASVLLVTGLLVGVARLVLVLEGRSGSRTGPLVRGVRAEPRQGAAAAERPVTRREVLEVLTAGQLDLAVQPVVSLPCGKPVGWEALSRFHRGPSSAPLPPAAVFAAAADAGVGVELEVLAVGRALDVLARLPAPLWLSVNVSPSTAASGRLARELRRAGPETLRRVVLELTEHCAVAEYDQLVDALAPLRAAGVRVAVDDAGAGFASFRHVVRLRPDIVKLDMSLIAGIDADPVRRSLVSSLLVFSADIGATVVAEGIETRQELDTLLELGVSWGQGYLLGRPVAAPAALEALLAERV
nr:EAL domain-containing protein [Motilibacter deserti]